MMAELRMGPLDAADGVTDPGRNRRPRPLGRVPQPPAPAAKTGGAGEFVDQRIAFGSQPGRSFDVVMCVRLGQIVVEVSQPGAVGGPGPAVEDRVGAERGERRGCPAVNTGDQLGRGHFPPRGGEQDREVAQALRVAQRDAAAVERNRPHVPVAAEQVPACAVTVPGGRMAARCSPPSFA